MGTSPITIGAGNDAPVSAKPITTAQRVTPPAQKQPPRTRKAEFVVCDQTIENFFCKLKAFRRIATRYDKTDTSFAAMIQLAASFLATK